MHIDLHPTDIADLEENELQRNEIARLKDRIDSYDWAVKELQRKLTRARDWAFFVWFTAIMLAVALWLVVRQ